MSSGAGAASRVVVVGSGAAGMAAAVSAARAGTRVLLLERAGRLGGTTALSGGVAWLPASGRELGGAVPDDTPDAAERYLRELGLGDTDPRLASTFAREAGPTAAALEEAGRLRLRALPYPDYHAERDGGSRAGRSLEPEPITPSPRVAELVRPAPNVHAPVTYAELATGEIDPEEVERRRREGTLTLGRALIAALLEEGLEAGIEVRTNARARRLVSEAGAITGVELDGERVDGRVVLASGGFERDAALARAFLRGPMLAPAGVPTCEGDGLRMALAAGAALGNMSEAWWCPALSVPGETIDGAPLHRLVLTERARPGSLIVDGRGRRFADEAQNYNDLGRSLHEFDPAEYSWPRVPSWLLFDGGYRRRYHAGPLRRDAPDPGWLVRAGDLASLAGAIGVPAPALTATVERFNRLAEEGRDADFGRGDYAYDRFVGDHKAPHPTLGPLAEPPFYAMRLIPGCLGTKGGPRTDDHGRVLGSDGGEPIPGLYAAGNAMASPFGLAYPGAGGTIGPALVFGMRAGAAAAAD
jgi:3-oxosteroid 1-dehydrogenase